MADFTLRSDHVDVEQIMGQIRARIKEKRGVDYTEEEVRELASVTLERFLDPRALRSDLLKHYRETRDARPVLQPPSENYAFDDTTIYASHRAPLRWIRRLLNPLLKLMFNPNPLIHVLHLQGRFNEHTAGQLERLDTHLTHLAEREALQYEVITNLVLELTRLGIETRNLKMRVESLSTRLDFDERRARALEGVVQYRQGALATATAEPPAGEEPEPGEGAAETDAAGRPAKRRRRRRGRRRGVGDEGTASAEGAGRDEGPEGVPHDADGASTPSADPAPSSSEGGNTDQQ